MAKPVTEHSSVETKLRELFLALCFDDDSVTWDSLLVEDIGLDSLDIVELVIAIEETFGIEIEDKEVEDLRTFGEVVTFVTKRVGA